MPEFNNNPSITRISADQIIYGSYVKIDRLDNIVYNAFVNTSISTATELNIFIDLNSVLHALFSENYRIDTPAITIITSCLINMCGHYRNFFTRLKVKTNFYMVYSNNTHDINRKFIAGYNESFYNKSKIKESVDFTKTNFDLLSIICPYLPDIYFIKSSENFEVGVIIAGIIEKLNDGIPNMIISKDIYPLQLSGIYKNTTFLYPSKSRTEGDVSRLITINESSNHRKEFWDLVAKMHKIKPDHLYNLSTINLPLFLSLTNLKEREITAITTPTQASNIIKSIIGDEDIKITIDQLNSIPIIMEKFPIVESRMKAIDIQFMLPYYMSSPEFNNLKFINLRDDSKLRQICSMDVFDNNPIDLRLI